MPTFGEVKTRATGTGYAQLGVSLINIANYFLTTIWSSHWYTYMAVCHFNYNEV